MDIIVKGSGKLYFKPEEISISLTFGAKTLKYDETLELGTKSVEEFVENILPQIGLQKENLKTFNFNLKEVTRYDSKNSKYEFEGYKFMQKSELKFDFDISKMTKFIEIVSKLKNPPQYTFAFNVKDVENCKNLAIKNAFEAAKNKAFAIAFAAGKQLGDCLKVDFQPFSQSLTSETTIGSSDIMFKASMERSSIADSLEKTFVPEDVAISETVYCLWKAE